MLLLNFKDPIVQLLQRLLSLLDVFPGEYQLCDFEGYAAETDHVVDSDARSQLVHVFEDEPAVLLDDQVWVPLVHLVRERFMDVIAVIVIHDVYQLIFLLLNLLF